MKNLWLKKKRFPIGSSTTVTFGGETSYYPCPILGYKWRGMFGSLHMIVDLSGGGHEIYVLAEMNSGFGYVVCHCDRDGSNERSHP